MRSKRFEYLCQPWKIGLVELRNRMTMAPTGTGLGNQHSGISERLIDYHQDRAKGGVGLITVEHTT